MKWTGRQREHRRYFGLCLLGLAATAALTVSCAGAPPDSDEVVSTSNSPGLDWQTFRKQSVSSLANGMFIVEGDMLFADEEAVHAYWLQTLAPRAGQPLTVNRVTVNGVTVDDLWGFPAGLNLTYCVRSNFTAAQNTQLLTALDAAADAWSKIVGVRHVRTAVTGTCDSANNGVVFDVSRVTGSGFNANSFFPSTPRASRTLLVDDVAFTTTANGRTLEGIITHEFGHIVGWRHEHIWTNATTGCTAETTDNARLVTAQVDQNSVMYYPQCRPTQDGGYHISTLDYTAGVQLYGLAPALITSIRQITI